MKFKKIVTIVLDSVGVGETFDTNKFGDQGANTLGNISKNTKLNLPNLEKLGLGNIADFTTIAKNDNPTGTSLKMNPKSAGKDTLAGHWEMMGVTINDGFNVYIKDGFPEELVEEFEKRVGRGVIANKEANGMQIIKEYYDEHINTGKYILYTSVDSTFQLAAHEEIIPLDELYKACEIARELTADPKYNVARVIARPFVGSYEDYYRTANRKDYALDPPDKTILDKLNSAAVNVYSIGKIYDIFNGNGITEYVKTKDNMDGVDKTIEAIKSDREGFVFTNLVDFDSKYGHPRDLKGYKEALEAFDARIPELINNLNDDTLLIITADHGNDPTFHGNDHTREVVPLILYANNYDFGEISDRNTFEDLGETIAINFGVEGTANGENIVKEIR